jgi:hypothetical protein
MNPQELQSLLRVRPFEPFRIHLTDQQHYDIRHPEMMLIGARTAAIGVQNDPIHNHFGPLITVSLLHIVKIEPLQPAAAN